MIQIHRLLEKAMDDGSLIPHLFLLLRFFGLGLGLLLLPPRRLLLRRLRLEDDLDLEGSN